MKKLMALWQQGFGVPDTERIEIGKEMWRVAVEQQWAIGTVGLSPAVMGVRIVSNRLGNSPDRLYNSTDGMTPAPVASRDLFLQVGAPSMLGYILRRLLIAMGTVWVISVIAFAIIQLPPGDYVTSYIAQLMATGTLVTQEEAENLRIQYGLHQPLYAQYARWVWLMLQGNFGVSMEWQRPVLEVIGDRLLLTALLAFAAVIFTWILAIPIGIYSAVRQYSIGDYIFTFIGFVGLAVPSFLLALVVMYLSFAYFGASIGGLFSTEYLDAPWSLARFWDLLQAPVGSGPYSRHRRHSAARAHSARQPAGRAAQALRRDGPCQRAFRAENDPQVPGAGRPQSVYQHHRLHPALSRLSAALSSPSCLSLPTVGPLLLKALIAQDMFLAGTIVLLLGLMTVIGTLISDILLVWIDPRIRLEE